MNSQWLFAVHNMTDGYNRSRGQGQRRYTAEDYSTWAMHRRAGKSHKEISALVGASDSTVRRRLQRMGVKCGD
jgi:hypothetical protein